MTIREYAESRNISYEAARKSLRKYESELSGHLIKEGKSTCLDDDAVAFLDTKRMVSASAAKDMAQSMSESEEIQKLSAENRNLSAKNSKLQKQNMELQEKLDMIQQKNGSAGITSISLEGGNDDFQQQNRALHEQNAGLEEQLSEMRRGNAVLQTRTADLQAENDDMKSRISRLQKENDVLGHELQSLKEGREEIDTSDIDMKADNIVLKSQVKDLKCRLHDLEDKTARLEADRVMMMDNDWQYIGDGKNIIKDGGYLIRHHFNSFERYENPNIAYVYDVFCAEKMHGTDDSMMASLTKIDVKDIGGKSWIDEDKILKKTGKTGRSGDSFEKIMPGVMWAKETVDLYGPIHCHGRARNGDALTENNILQPKEEIKQWLEDIGAEDFIDMPKKKEKKAGLYISP